MPRPRRPDKDIQAAVALAEQRARSCKRDSRLHVSFHGDSCYRQLGIDYHKTYFNEANRPIEMLNYGEPIEEIL